MFFLICDGEGSVDFVEHGAHSRSKGLKQSLHKGAYVSRHAVKGALSIGREFWMVWWEFGHSIQRDIRKAMIKESNSRNNHSQ